MSTDKRQFTMRMQPENYDKIRVIAIQNKRSVAAQIEYLLERCIKDYETEHGVIVYTSTGNRSGMINNNLGGTNYIAMGGGNNYSTIMP